MFQLMSLVLVVVMWLQVPPADKPSSEQTIITPASVVETRNGLDAETAEHAELAETNSCF